MDGTELVAVPTTDATAEETDEAETAGQLVGTETVFVVQLDVERVGQLVGTATTVVVIFGVETTGGTVATVVVQLEVRSDDQLVGTVAAVVDQLAVEGAADAEVHGEVVVLAGTVAFM